MKMKKATLLLFLVLEVFALLKANPVSLPDYDKGIDKYVSDCAGVLTDAQKDQIKNRLNDYDKATSVELAVVLINSVGDYGYTDVTQFATDLFDKWKIGKAVAHNGVIYVIDVKGKHSSIRTGYGVEEGLGAITASKILASVKEKRMSGDYAGAINGVIDGVQDALKKTDATNVKAIMAETAKKQELERNADIANAGNWIIIFFLGALCLLPFVIFYLRYRARVAQKKAAAAALKKKFDDFTEMKESMRVSIINCKDSIKSCRGVDNMLSDDLDNAEKVVNEVECSRAMVAVSENEFNEMLNSEREAMIMVRNDTYAKLNRAVRQIAAVQSAKTESIRDRKVALDYELDINNIILFYVVNKINAYHEAIVILSGYPRYLSEFNLDAINSSISKVKESIETYRAEAKALSDEARSIKFAIGAYADVLKRITAHSNGIQACLNGLTDAVVKRADELSEAISSMKKFNDVYILQLKQDAVTAANHSDVTSASRQKVDALAKLQPKHTDDIIGDWVFLQTIISAINSATLSCRRDIDSAIMERERIRREEQERERRRREEIAAAALAAEEAIRRSNESSFNSSSWGGGGSYSSPSDFGGGGTSGGGASD